MQTLPPDIDVYVVEEVANPSTDYFVLPACQGQGRRVHRCGFPEVPEPSALHGAAVVFVRYLPAAWRKRVEQVRDRLAALIYFMDDDLLDVQASAGLPWRYRYKLYSLATWHAGWLRRVGATMWVSTRWLSQKYLDWEPHVVSPRPLPARSPGCRLFYHGTASHGAEIGWLRPVVEQILLADPGTSFEIVGGPAVARLYRALPRVTVVHPMRWTAYQPFLDLQGRQVGLAPLLDAPFNRARSHTKFFDITRAGAVGVYSLNSACAEVVRNGIDGVLLPMEPKAWVETVLALARDAELRARMIRNAHAALAS